MDRVTVVAASAVTALAVLAGFVAAGTPEGVAVALVASGAVAGASSRTYQSEFLDAWAAGCIGFAVAVTVVFFELGGIQTTNSIAGGPLNMGVLVYVGLVAFAPVAALFAALGGEFGARVRSAVRDARGES